MKMGTYFRYDSARASKSKLLSHAKMWIDLEIRIKAEIKQLKFKEYISLVDIRLWYLSSCKYPKPNYLGFFASM